MINISNLRFDSYVNSPYQLGHTNAKKLREYLINNLVSKGINLGDFNRQNKSNKPFPNPPLEIYEYQSFFLLQKNDGELILLDGFRRLLWYDAPDHEIQVRVYNESDLKSEQIMKLLIYLNHFKFYGGDGKYFDRGFALAMFTIFGLNIPKYYSIFNAYLTLEETQRSYSRESVSDDQENTNVKERMLNPMFISDMNFIEELIGKDVILNENMGALIYKIRTNNPEFVFDSKEFLSHIDGDEIIKGLQERYKKVGDTTSAESQKTINQIIPLYENIFKKMLGIEVEKTYAEKKDEAKKISQQLKKDKKLTKITGHRECYLLEMIIKKRLENNIPINFKCVVYPLDSEISAYSWNRDKVVKLPHGLLEYPITFLGTKRKSLGGVELLFGFTTKEGKEFTIQHNLNGFYGYGKKYVRICHSSLPSTQYDIDLFVDITKDEIVETDKNRF